MGSNGTSKNKYIKKELLLIVLLMVIAVILLVIGVSFNRSSKPKTIYSKTINSIYNYTNKMMHYDKKDTVLGNNINDTYNLKLNVNSEEDIFKTNYNLKQLYRYYNNISRTKTTINFKQDLSNKKFLFTMNTTLNNQNLINKKILVDDSTKYEYLEGLKDNYINLGNAIYFETINSHKDKDYNTKYIKDFIINSLIKNINEEDITTSKVETTYDENNVKLIKYNLKLDDMKLRLLINSIIKDIKKDSRAKNIMYIINPNLKKIKPETKLLEKNEFIEFSIYTNNLYHVKKFEFGHIIDKVNKTMSFEPTDERIRIETKENNKLDTITTLVRNKDNYIASIVDNKEQSIGSIEFDREEKKTSLVVGYSHNKKIDIVYDRSIIKLDEKKSYTQDINLSVNIVDVTTMKKILNLNISCINNASKYVKIEEETSNIILYDSLTKEEKHYLKDENNRVKNKLLS